MVDCDFPGGNIIVDAIEGNTVELHQDLRDTEGDWFYWYFRVRGAAGRTLNFEFTKGNVIGVRGPAVSSDGGWTWRWLAKEAVKEATFQYTFPDDAEEIRFCFAMPYLERNLQRFIRCYEGNPNLKVDVLCKKQRTTSSYRKTRKGRDVELLHLGRLDGECDYRVLLTCRHHACEMMASYTLEGIMESILADTEDGRWLREHVEFLVIPFVDKDGVEDGDQGKNRKPHDHNRDYNGESIYPSVKAIRELVPEWSAGRLKVAIDLHCPHIRGTHNEVIYMVGNASKAIWKRQLEFGKILESVQTGPLVYRTENDLPFGEGWNTSKNYAAGKSSSRWASELDGIQLVTSFEIPYANARGIAVTQESAKTFGYDIVKALHRFFIHKC
jgi:hypothetical protein